MKFTYDCSIPSDSKDEEEANECTEREWPTYDKGNTDIRADDVAAAAAALISKRLFRYDNRAFEITEAGTFEANLAKYFSTKHALACASGTTALALALMSAGIGPGDEVLVPAFTFAATPSAVILAGAKPVIVEVDENLHFDVTDMQQKITPRTRAVIAVHMRGFACDVVQIAEVANHHGLVLIEDAVPALGVKFGDRYLGTFGQVGAFSTQSDKAINTGEGGFILTSNDDLYARAVVLSGAYERRLHRHSSLNEVTMNDLDLPIFSFRMDEVRAAIGKAQLLSLPERVRTQQENYKLVADAVAGCSGLIVRQPAHENSFLGESFIFRLAGSTPEKVNNATLFLKERGIDARGFGDMSSPNVRAFWNWRFLFPGASQGEIMRMLPNSARYISEAIDVPLSFDLRPSELRKFVDALSELVRRVN